MIFDPTQQMNLFGAMTRAAVTTATTAMATSATTMEKTFSAAATSCGGVSRKTRKSKKAKSKGKTTSQRNTSARRKPTVVEDTIDLAFAPMKIALDAMKPAAPKAKAVPSLFPAWMAPAAIAPTPTAPNPFSYFFPWAQLGNTAPMPFAWLQPQSAATPFMAGPFGQETRSPFEKIADPFDLSSNVVEFPSWAAKAKPPVIAGPAAFDNFAPAKMAAALAPFMMTPKFLQSAGAVSPWSGFAAAFGG